MEHWTSHPYCFKCTQAEHWHGPALSDMISRPLSILPVTESCTIPPRCKCYGAKGRVFFLLVRKQGANTIHWRNERKGWALPMQVAFSDTTLHCKCPASELMQICPPKKWYSTQRHFSRSSADPPSPCSPAVLPLSSLNLYPRGNPSAQLKRQPLQLHSSYSRFLLAEWAASLFWRPVWFICSEKMSLGKYVLWLHTASCWHLHIDLLSCLARSVGIMRHVTLTAVSGDRASSQILYMRMCPAPTTVNELYGPGEDEYVWKGKKKKVPHCSPQGRFKGNSPSKISLYTSSSALLFCWATQGLRNKKDREIKHRRAWIGTSYAQALISRTEESF